MHEEYGNSQLVGKHMGGSASLSRLAAAYKSASWSAEAFKAQHQRAGRQPTSWRADGHQLTTGSSIQEGGRNGCSHRVHGRADWSLSAIERAGDCLQVSGRQLQSQLAGFFTRRPKILEGAGPEDATLRRLRVELQRLPGWRG